jgi:hypothetical protein
MLPAPNPDTADKIGDTTAGVLQTYVEKKLLGL